MDKHIVIARTSHLLESVAQDELFALDVERGSCFSFNHTATAIWGILEKPMTLEALCTALTAKYDVDPATCLSDTMDVLEQLSDNALVTFTKS
jgi:hypothetical protein